MALKLKANTVINTIEFTTQINNSMNELIKRIKWMCFNIYITFDNKVYSLDGYPQRTYIINGKTGYKVNCYFRDTDWIKQNCVNIENFIEL